MLAASKAKVVPGSLTSIVAPLGFTVADQHAGDEVALLLRRRRDLMPLRVVVPGAIAEAAAEQDRGTGRQRPAAHTALRRVRPRHRLGNAIGRLYSFGGRDRYEMRSFVHAISCSSKTPWAVLPSLPLRSIANR